MKWKHFPHYWPFVRGIHRSPVNSPHKGQWCLALMFSLIWAWINGWVNNREAGDLRRHRAHYEVTVMNFFHIYALVFYRSQKCFWKPYYYSHFKMAFYLSQQVQNESASDSCWLLMSNNTIDKLLITLHSEVGQAQWLNTLRPGPPQHAKTLNVRGPSYLGLTRSISWLLMP